RQATDAAADVLDHVRRLGRPWASHGNGRVADDVLEEELRPRFGVEIRGPLWKRSVASALEELRAARATHSVRVAEGEERHHADLPFLGERQNLVFGEAIAHVIVDADEIDWLIPHDRLELCGLGLHHNRLHSDVPDAPGLFLLLQ